MDKFLAPFPMLTGSSGGKALLVIGVLVALAIAAKQKSQTQQVAAS
jgi:hypothetical protein